MNVNKDKKVWIPIGDQEQFGFKLDKRSDFMYPRPISNIDDLIRKDKNIHEMFGWANLESSLTSAVKNNMEELTSKYRPINEIKFHTLLTEMRFSLAQLPPEKKKSAAKSLKPSRDFKSTSMKTTQNFMERSKDTTAEAL